MDNALILQGKIENDTSTKILDIHFLFDIIESNNIEADADITDHYVEDNTAKQDHMAIKPIRYTLSGYVGEKVFHRTAVVISKITADEHKMGGVWTKYQDPYKSNVALNTFNTMASVFPTLSNYAQTALNAYGYAEAAVKRYYNNYQDIKKIFNKDKTTSGTTSTITKSIDKIRYNTETLPIYEIIPSKQTDVFKSLDELRKNRTEINLNTPFENFGKKPFLIESVKMEQGATAAQSRLTVTVKEYRPVATETVKIDASKYAGRVATQKATEDNLGKVKGNEDISSPLYNMTYGTWGDPTRSGHGASGSW